MNLSLSELVLIAALSLGVALVVIGMLIGMLIAIFLPRPIPRDDGQTAIDRRHPQTLPHCNVSNPHQ